MLVKYKFAPGVNKEGTEYTADSGWYDSDKIRFRKGRPEQIGGWEKFSPDTFFGICRSLHDWKAAAATDYLGFGTTVKYYINKGTAYYDVTPIRETTSAGDVTFSASNGDATLTVADTSHGAQTGDFVTFSGAVSLGGNITAAVLNQEYQLTVVNGNSYTIEAKDTGGSEVLANSSDTGNGGSSVVGTYQINAGLDTFVPSTGYGAGTWGSASWGGSTTISSSNQLRLYSEDTFGDDLIINPRGGDIYYWDESSGLTTRAATLASNGAAVNCPVKALQVIVSDTDRHVIAFGTNAIGSTALDPLFIRWSDQENPFDWTPTATNTSGGVSLPAGSFIMGAVKTRQEILIFTDSSIHSMRFSGSPFTYQFSLISEAFSMISPKAAISAGEVVYFMDRGGFYFYNGSIQRITCSVLDYVFSNINESEIFKVFATISLDFSEVTWFYPIGSGNSECTNYVTYNFKEDSWSVGTLDRGAWIPANTRNWPIAADNTSANEHYLYFHERGFDADGEAMNSYIESGGIELGDGEQFMFMSRMIPDFEFKGAEGLASMAITVKGKDYPLENAQTLSSSTVTSSTTQTFIRARARETIVRIQSTGTGYGWTLGDLRFDVRSDGRR
jgi:hypothetical protein